MRRLSSPNQWVVNVYRVQGATLQEVVGWIDANRTHWQVRLDYLKNLMEN
jgi:hypothetical protein